MKTIYETPNIDKKTRYNLMKAPDMEKMSVHVGEIISVKCFCMREDNKLGDELLSSSGEIKQNFVLSIMDDQGVIYSTNSPTFIREFSDAYDVFGAEDIHHVEIVGGRSKAGRNYITCKYID